VEKRRPSQSLAEPARRPGSFCENPVKGLPVFAPAPVRESLLAIQG